MFIDIRKKEPPTEQDIKEQIVVLQQRNNEKAKSIRICMAVSLMLALLSVGYGVFAPGSRLEAYAIAFVAIIIILLSMTTYLVQRIDKYAKFDRELEGLETFFDMSVYDKKAISQLHTYCEESDVCRQYMHKINEQNRQLTLAEFEAMRCQYLREQRGIEEHDIELKVQTLREI